MAEALTEVQVRAFEHAGDLFDRFVEDAVTGRRLGVVKVHTASEASDAATITIDGGTPAEYIRKHLGFVSPDEEFVEETANYFQEAMTDMWADTMTALAELEVDVQALAVSSTAGYLDYARALHEEVWPSDEPGGSSDAEIILTSRVLVHADLLEWQEAEKSNT